MLSAKAGKDVRTHSGAEILRNDIEARTGEALSLNTVKRLTGVLAYSSTPREVTLDIISRYLGYKNWALFLSAIENKISGFNTPEGFIETKDLPVGSVLKISWEPDREIKILHRGKGAYEIIESKNSKLQKGDEIHLSQIAPGFPLMVREVNREGECLGNYTAALTEGITSLELLNG